MRFMADVFQRLPLLVLVVLLLLLLVVFHVCILGIVPRCGRRKRSSKKGVVMEGRQGMCRSARDQGGSQRAGQNPWRSSRSSERSGYVHLPPHLQPLPDTSDEEAEGRRSRTVPLGSGSTQEWAATELGGSRDGGNGQSYTELLQQRLSVDEGDGGVNLSSGLCSGRSSATLQTVIVNNHPDDDGGQLTVVARSSKSPAVVGEALGNNRDPPRQQYWSSSVSRGASARPLWMQSPSPLSASSTAARRRGECGETDCGIADVADARDMRERLKKVRVDREAEWCGKKWDNLVQQFRKVHHFQLPRLIRETRLFQLSGKERLSKGFNFNMDRVVYDEILGSTAKSHTINPKNVADIGAPGVVRLPFATSADPEFVGDGDAGAGHDDDEHGSTRGSSQTTGSPPGFGKRKSTRQQTFEALPKCMEKHGALVVSTMESNSKRQCSIQIRQCKALEVEVEVQKKHYALLEIAKAIRERWSPCCHHPDDAKVRAFLSSM
ncbi:hypothetical protein CBR_g45812 [Chara braunii]|uniref:Uncharacterized protein n=1 Tax=Chara braunii TaxID=69332 RepID=A0A388LZM2_CHABU|nr:hypothetical protein CBR_g45812 [Chara braunii]|eukprot:GBG87659.1 hypothetical protein CBR_g45812 [Chara braunii]